MDKTVQDYSVATARAPYVRHHGLSQVFQERVIDSLLNRFFDHQ
jgi:hypothetical protein